MKVPNETNGVDIKEINPDTCIYSCIPRCEKGISPNNRMESKMQFNGFVKSLDDSISIENACKTREINLESILLKEKHLIERDRISRNLPIQSIFASNYLNSSEPYITKLVLKENFREILNVARLFPGNLTSFLGFECRLGEPDSRTDWAFAISGLNGDRFVFENLLKNGYLPDQLLIQKEWRQIKNFAKSWADSESILNDKVQCFWLEFDMPKDGIDIPIPCIFFGPTKLPIGLNVNDYKNYEWLSKVALPMLRGQPLSKVLEINFRNTIEQMPTNATLFQIGTLLSRSTDSIRIYVNKLRPKQVIPYLNSIGWFDDTGEFTKLINDIKNMADRFVLSFDINEDGIGQKIGIELSFTTKTFQNETRWSKLLDYLVDKDLCLSEKREALQKYQGSEEDFTEINMEPLKAASGNLNKIFTSTIVRYISHVKIVYEPGDILEAKAYPAVRLFEKSDLN
ncbi:MAG: hypothetical protein AYK22_05910 [Thermoplasmatales archaeon SG8-52-3]|nr:MAG: hypothetical protein AYK22_05910 [Thermoplasmatales archaeon SG8-52-3]